MVCRRALLHKITFTALIALCVSSVCSAQEADLPPPQGSTSATAGDSLEVYWVKQLGNKSHTRQAVWTVKEVPDPKTKRLHQVFADIATSQPLPQKLMQDLVFSGAPIFTEQGIIPKSCRAMVQPDGSPVVAFDLKPDAAKSLKAFSSAHLGEYLAIFVNDEMLTSPCIDGPMADKCQIAGNFTTDEIKQLAVILNRAAESNTYNNLWPLTKGTMWTFDSFVTDTASTLKSTITQVVSVTDIRRTPLGDEATVEYRTGNNVATREVYRSTAAGLWRIAGGPTGDSTIEPPLQVVKYPVSIGERWNWSGEVHAGGQVFTASAITTSAETVHIKTDSGFYRAVRIRIELDISQGAEKAHLVNDYWLAPGVGLVKQKLVVGTLTVEGKLTKFAPAK